MGVPVPEVVPLALSKAVGGTPAATGVGMTAGAVTVMPQPARELSVTGTQLLSVLVLPEHVTGTTATTLSAVSVMLKALAQAGTAGLVLAVLRQA